MAEYIEYCLFNRDDSPLYLFESNIEEHPKAKEMCNEYQPPRYLRQDYFVELVSVIVLLWPTLCITNIIIFCLSVIAW